jgi:transcriptional regulator with XRE-family HTH domain
MSDSYTVSAFLTPSGLHEIREARRESLREFGESLGRLLVKDRPYTKEYISMLEHGRAPITSDIQRGVLALGAGADGADEFAASLLQAINVLSVHDIDGAVVLGEKRKCAYPPCRVWFVGVTPTQRYHSLICRMKMYAITREEEKRRKQAVTIL